MYAATTGSETADPTAANILGSKDTYEMKILANAMYKSVFAAGVISAAAMTLYWAQIWK